MKVRTRVAALVLSVLATSLGHDAPAAAKDFEAFFPGVHFKDPEVQHLADSFGYQRGPVKLPLANATLQVGANFYFLDAEDARRVLVDLWDNPPQIADGVLGMILPAEKAPVEETWGALVTFAADGYVSDAAATKIDYGRLLSSMKARAAAVSAARVNNGFGAMRLVDWASPPAYDALAHKLRWATELQFNDSAHHSVNYDLRALGRRGVLKINIVGGYEQLAAIEAAVPQIMAMPEFDAGARYQDFVAGTDRRAPYGVAGLIAGPAAAAAEGTDPSAVDGYGRVALLAMLTVAAALSYAWWLRDRASRLL